MNENNQQHGGDDEEGVPITFIREQRFNNMREMDKIRTILDAVQKGDAVVLEKGLSPDEESELVQSTMREINQESFTGIEIETYPNGDGSGGGLMSKVFGRNDDDRPMTVITAADQLQTVAKDADTISMVLRGE